MAVEIWVLATGPDTHAVCVRRVSGDTFSFHAFCARTLESTHLGFHGLNR